jgi:hypothetical protein
VHAEVHARKTHPTMSNAASTHSSTRVSFRVTAAVASQPAP